MNLPWTTKNEVLIELAQLRDRNKELEALVVEITKEHEELKKTTTLLRKVFETIPDLFTVIDKNHRILLSNWHGGYEYVPEPLRSGNPLCYEAFYGRKAPCDQCHLKAAFESGEQVIREKINPKIGWVKIHTFPIPDDSGKTAVVLEHIREITEKKKAQLDLLRYREHLVEMVDERTSELNQANEDLTRENAERREVEEALRASEEKFRAVAETSPAAIFLYQGEKFIYVNPSAERLIGYTHDEFLAMKFWDWVHPDFSELVRTRGLARQRGVPLPPEYEFCFITKAGEERWGILSAKCIEFASKPTGIAAFVDITDRKRAEIEISAMNEELQQRSEQLLVAQEELVRKEKLAILGQLSGSVAHELRNPLGVMNNAVYFLKSIQTNADEMIKEYLDIISQEIENAGRIISDILDFSRTRTPNIIPTEPFLLVKDALEKCDVPECIAISVDIPDSLPLLKVDPLQMDQVLQNLISNACQAMPHGGSVTISARPVLDSRLEIRNTEEYNQEKGTLDVEPCSDFLEISVTDNGKGISPENMKKLFQPLFTTKVRGIGLGLTVCRNLTEANGGSITAVSRADEGTVFRVTLPVEGGDAWKER
ncbi:MAG: PAS domain S-box protein [Geobacter sp.]|nr:MAG: PAS domain S-box protein [Geobacter sp.]